MNVLEEVTRRYVERENATYGDGYQTVATASPWIGAIVADVLDLLSADGRLHPTHAPRRAARAGGVVMSEARGTLGDLCWCPVADGSGHYWHPTVCPSTPTPEPTTTRGEQSAETNESEGTDA